MAGGPGDGGDESVVVVCITREDDFDFVALLCDRQLINRALAGDLAGNKDRDAVAHHFEFAEEVAVDEDGFALIAEVGQDVADVAAADGVDAIGGFVEEDEVGVVDEGLGEADALHHAFGVGANFAISIGGHADGIEKFARAALAGFAIDAGESGKEFQSLAAGQVAGEAVVFGEVADVAEGGFVADGVIEEGAFGAGGADDGHHDFDESGFARAVGAEEAEDFAAADAHFDAAECLHFATIGFGDVVEVDGEIVADGGAHGGGR